MASEKGAIDQLGEELKQLRDEIELQIHLASADARDEYAELEKKWNHFRSRVDVVAGATEEAAEDVGDALELLGKEIKKGFQKIRTLL